MPPAAAFAFHEFRYTSRPHRRNDLTMADKPLARRTILTICCLFMSTGSLVYAASAIFVTDIAGEFDMNLAQRGLFLGTPMWGQMVAMLVAAWLADRFGCRIFLVIGSVLQTAGFFMMANASALETAVIGALTLGIGRGMVSGLLTPIACAVYPQRRTQIANLLHSFFHSGMAAIVLFLLLFVEVWLWRPVFQALGLLTLPNAAVAFFMVLPAQSHQGTVRMPLGELFTRLPFLLLLCGTALAVATELGAAAWLVSFVEQVTDAGQKKGAAGLLLFAVLMTIGRLSATTMIRRFGVVKVFAGGGGICTVSLLVAAMNPGPWVTIMALAAVGFGVATTFPTLLGAAGDRFPQGGASMFACLMAAAMLGGALGPQLLGVAAEGFGLQAAMAMLVIAPLAAIGIVAVLARWPRDQADDSVNVER